ncbi:hypothetical protein [Virgisporangium aurantiacum]|uniref:Uncharacterized protein n=1 Tax=Virgisporangium aurantiacum TaxID=175570 RepID=A0A8J3Z074_9ACTN|nr:hypothetical protein [Virgisporangium aurantiacum]GIJ55006.1 hypothetical protein Vau01_025220 [Virgisporangium aurantiacum]
MAGRSPNPVSQTLSGEDNSRRAVERRLPGRARPAHDVLREYNEFNAKRRQRIPSILWIFVAPDPDGCYRWRVQLDCDCVTEVLTGGDDPPPSDHHWLDPVHQQRLPTGQLSCKHDDSPPAPYRQITERSDRREVSFPADPIEPPDWTDADTWAVVRRDKPHSKAFWTVALACGHVTEVPTDLTWKPTDGPRRVGPERQRKMTTEFEAFWATQPDGQSKQEQEHTRRMLADGWPMPRPEQLCYRCPDARLIVAYQRVGWLVPRKTLSTPPKQPSRAALQRRLERTQAEADRLRQQLAQLDTDKHANAAG